MVKKLSKRQRIKAIKQWAATPTCNTDYRGATPNDVGRALLSKRPPADPAIKSHV